MKTENVALRKESVDRNTLRACAITCMVLSLSARRAWIEILVSTRQVCLTWSLSARRAWIEIMSNLEKRKYPEVALRKESVDRNSKINTRGSEKMKSLSARRAWIEMIQKLAHLCLKPSLSARRAWIEIANALPITSPTTVALRKESVDRNIIGCAVNLHLKSRSPQGERG